MSQDSARSEARSNLLNEIEREQRDRFFLARLNNNVDIILAILTVVASVVASILAARSNPSATWVAALPAIFTGIQSKVDLPGNATRYYSAYEDLRELHGKIQGGMTEAKARERLSEIRKDLNEKRNRARSNPTSPSPSGVGEGGGRT